MSIAMIAGAAGLAATGTFLITSRSLSRIVIGFVLLGHATVLALLAAGGYAQHLSHAAGTDRHQACTSARAGRRQSGLRH